MTLEECYESFGGNYADVSSRLPRPAMIEKFMLKFLSDPSHMDLHQALKGNNLDDAFRAAHTLKGICANLGFARLFESSSRVTEILRHNETDWQEVLDVLDADYEQTIRMIQKYQMQKDGE